MSKARELADIFADANTANELAKLDGSAKLTDAVFPAVLPAVDGSNLTGVAETKPTISSISPDTIDNTEATITVTGANFESIPKVEVLNPSTGIWYDATSVTFNNSTSLTVVITLSVDAQYKIRIENPNGLAVLSGTILTVSDAPTWVTGASLGSFAGDFSGTLATLSATSDSAITYSEVGSNLTTANVTLNTSTGALTTTDFGGSSTTATTYNFTIRATDAENQTADRSFSLTSSYGATGGGDNLTNEYNFQIGDLLMASTYLSRTQGTATLGRKYTFSIWIKRNKITDRQQFIRTPGYAYFEFQADDRLHYYDIATGGDLVTNRVFRDTNSWYHIVLSVDTSLTTADDRHKIYVNGVQETSFAGRTNPTQNNGGYFFDNGRVMYIGSNEGSNLYFNGCMSHLHGIDGTAYDASAFGETDANGVWKIKTSPSVTYGNNGFFILKDGNSVTDQSGNGNNFTVAGGTLTNTEDNPSNVFCTYNPLIPSDLDYANGNTDVQQTSNTDWEATKGTLGFTKGKYYWEVKISSNSGDPWDQFHGIAGENAITSGATYDATPSVFFGAGGSIDVDGTTQQSSLGQSSDGDIIGIAVDADNSNIDFYRNGTQVGTTQALSSNSGFWLPFSGFAGNRTCQGNFGNGYFGTTAVSSAGTNASGIGIFEYDVPTGYTALSTKGLNL